MKKRKLQKHPEKWKKKKKARNKTVFSLEAMQT